MFKFIRGITLIDMALQNAFLKSEALIIKITPYCISCRVNAMLALWEKYNVVYTPQSLGDQEYCEQAEQTYLPTYLSIRPHTCAF